MGELERQLTAALVRLSAQSEMNQGQQAKQIEALRQRVDRQTEQSEALQTQVERL